MDDYLSEMRRFARANKIPVVLDDTREYLENLCKEIRPKAILEIGMAIGYSSSCMLRVCDANITELEASLPNISIAKDNYAKLGLTNRVNIIIGDCVKTLSKLNGKKFDLIFLDGPKDFYLQMLPELLDLMTDDGVFVSDNVLFRGMVRDGVPITMPKFEKKVAQLREFLNTLENNNKLETQVLHIGDGLAVVRKKKGED